VAMKVLRMKLKRRISYGRSVRRTQRSPVSISSADGSQSDESCRDLLKGETVEDLALKHKNLTVAQRQAQHTYEENVKTASFLRPTVVAAVSRLESVAAKRGMFDDTRKQAEIEAARAEMDPRVDLGLRLASCAATAVDVGSSVRIANGHALAGQIGQVIARHPSHPLWRVKLSKTGEERLFKQCDVTAQNQPVSAAPAVRTTDATPEVGSVVVVMNTSQMKNPHQLARVGQVGTLRDVDHSISPYCVEFLDGSEWFKACDVAPTASSDAGSEDVVEVLPGWFIGDRVRRKPDSSATVCSLRNSLVESGLVIGRDSGVDDRIMVRFQAPHGSRNLSLHPDDLIKEADWHHHIVAKCTAEGVPVQEELERVEKACADAKHALREASRTERKSQSSAVQAARRLHKAGRVAEPCVLVRCVKFKNDTERPVAWRDLPEYVTYEWAVRIGKANLTGRSVMLSLPHGAAVARAVLKSDVEVNQESGVHILQLQSDQLATLRKKDKNYAVVCISIKEAKLIVRSWAQRIAFPQPLQSFGLLKAALGALDDVSLDSAVQEFFDCPETGIIRAKDIAAPAELQATLRPYQHLGFQWLVSNARNGVGCILADDMGLGKTIQAIALLLYLKRSGQLVRPALVVVPTGLLSTWRKEVERWAPSLLVHTYHGYGREMLAGASTSCNGGSVVSNSIVSDAVLPSSSPPLSPQASSIRGLPASAAQSGGGTCETTPRRRVAGKCVVNRSVPVSEHMTPPKLDTERGTHEDGQIDKPVRAARKRVFIEESADIFLTSYGVLRSDIDQLVSNQAFGCMILDEAQQIKNYNTLVSKAVKRMADTVGSIRVALSGTPVENRLSDLHSQFEFILPGYLTSSRAEFDRDFSRPMSASDDLRAPKQQQLLQRMIQPFVMRRLKEDPAIAADLPAKVEQTYLCDVPEEQAALYRAVQSAEFESLEQPAGDGESAPAAFKRRGKVLTMMHALREVCNHPANLKPARWPSSAANIEERPSRASIDASGKCVVLRDILSSVLESGEKALIFCQYLETIDILAEQIHANFKFTPLKFVGSMDGAQREQAVDAFQSNAECKVMLLSLQAGGIGLTLTAATHVIHFDRCYNPARENQATDRAHRIGQTKTVFVHRLIAKGTFEEKLAEVMQSRQQLSNLAIQAGEGWIADLDTAQLKELFALGGDGPALHKKRRAT